MRIAVIDLGSNTFHLLIVDVLDDGSMVEGFRKRTFVSLGEGGIDILTTAAIQRGISACFEMQHHLSFYNVVQLSIIGTAALRSASNSNEFIDLAEKIFKSKITIIDGDMEANYIFKGVKLLCPMIERSVIMDIGGGSTEFIIVENGQKLWAQSYKLGINVLHALFHNEEPISVVNEEKCRAFIRDTLALFFIEVSNGKVFSLIGASGAFEIFEKMTGKEVFTNKNNFVDLQEAQQIINKIVKANYQERQEMKGLSNERVKLIVVGMILVDEILKILNPEQLIVTPYSLKEGVLNDLKMRI